MKHRLVPFAVQRRNIFCEVGIEFLNIMYTYFSPQEFRQWVQEPNRGHKHTPACLLHTHMHACFLHTHMHACFF